LSFLLRRNANQSAFQNEGHQGDIIARHAVIESPLV
jgi:hypothetical protein